MSRPMSAPEGRKKHSYIVTSEGHPMWAESRKSISKAEQGILYIGGPTVTAFASRRAADRAIQRTVRYAREHGYSWGDANSYRIFRLEVQS